MTQVLVVAAVARIWRDDRGRATSLDVAAELEAHPGYELDRADVSRTLRRAERNGRLSRTPGHTAQGGWFHYEYAPTAKGLGWLRWLRADRERSHNALAEADKAVAEPPDGNARDDTECDACGERVGETDRFCRACGVAFDECATCGEVQVDGDCVACGAEDDHEAGT